MKRNKYSLKMVSKAEEYLASCDEKSVKGAKGKTRLSEVNIPTQEGLALALGIHKNTLTKWAKKHKRFGLVLDKMNNIQADRLIKKGLSGEYNAAIAKLILAKHGYKEERGLDLRSPNGAIVGVVFLPRKRKNVKQISSTQMVPDPQTTAGIRTAGI